MSFRSRYFELLGRAYDVPEGAERFDDFLDGAMAFFFADEEGAELSGDVPRDGGPDAELEGHSGRIARLIARAQALETTETAQEAGRFHAVLRILNGSGTVEGNPAAAALMGVAFPCNLSDLPLDPGVLRDIHRTIAQASGEGQDRVLLATVEAPDVRTCLALVHRPKNSADVAHVSISYIDWSDALLRRLGDAFGLSASETEVLEGYLCGLSQKEIAAQRGRALETIKAQSKTILRKSGCPRMSDVVQLSASIAYLLRQLPEDREAARPAVVTAEAWEAPLEGVRWLEREGGRRLAWHEAGSRAGGSKTVLFVHGFIQGPYFTRSFETGLERAGIRLIAPSRPGFGYTSPSASRADFDQVVVEDALALVGAQVDDGPITVMAHQGGTSHAFRIAQALEARAAGLFVLDGGVPIREEYLARMDRQTRLAAAATRHAPSVMRMVLDLGLPVYRRRGVEAFLRRHFASAPLDLATLDDPEMLRLQGQGCYHLMQQGSETWLRDGGAAMTDWSADMAAVSTLKQFWMHPEHCTVIDVQAIADCVAQIPGAALERVAQAGTNLLYTHGPDVARALSRFTPAG